jgi:putative DNA primase/helicase
VCENDTLTILTRSNQSFEAGAYQCWAGCSCDDIREALGFSKNGQSNGNSKYRSVASKVIQLPRAPTIPRQVSFISSNPNDTNFGIWDGNRRVTKYHYSATQYVERIEWMETSDNGLKREKTFRQYSNGNFGKGVEPWEMYRYNSIASDGNVVLLLEGEKCVDTAWQYGLAATCPQGSCYTDSDLARYSTQFLARKIIPLIIPDHDLSGERKLQKWVKALSLAGVFYSIARLPSFYGWQQSWDLHELLSVYPMETMHYLHYQILPQILPQRKKKTA